MTTIYNMKTIKDVLEKHTIVVLNQALKHGFAQIPRYVLCDHRLSMAARLTYAVLLSYAWQQDSCFPGQDRMAVDLGVTRRAVINYLMELRDCNYISWQRRGLGKTNIYYILDYQPLKIEADVNRRALLDVTYHAHTDVNNHSHKYIQNNKPRRNRNS
jgi:hypothetical protein